MEPYKVHHSWPSVDAFRDSLWMTEAEWKSLVPENPKKGDSFPVARSIRDRIFQFSLSDRYRGGPGGSRDFGGISQLGRMPTMAARGMAVKNVHSGEGGVAVK